MKRQKTAQGGTKNKADAKVWKVLKTICKYIYKLRGILISIPVLIASVMLMFKNLDRLPEAVGIGLLATGEYERVVTRSTAVVVPFLITLFCIILTCCSKRTLFPWLISIFTLVLPILIWVINIYPA